MAMFSTKGLILAQHKEPAFSHRLVRFVSPQTESMQLSEWPDKPVDELSPDEIVDLARSAAIIDERDGKFLYRKLLKAKGKAVAVVADAIDDEPYVSSQIAPMLQLRGEAIGGLRLCGKVAGTDKLLILAYKHITDLETRIPKIIEGVTVLKLRSGYPAESRGGDLRVGKGKRLIIGTGALIHLYRAAAQRRPQTTTFVTVAGECIANPMNLEVSLNMTVMQVLERCGMTLEPTRVVCGGPMTGIAILDADRTMITHTTRAVLAFRENKRDAYYNCIGCGRCEQVCPSGLNPMYIYRFVDNSYFANLKPFDAHLCIGCGTCSYICPSKLGVAGAVMTAREYAREHFITPAEEEDDF